MKAISAILTILIATNLATAQVDEARQAIDRGEYVRAVNILSAALADRPTPDTYLYLGLAYLRMKEYAKAEDIMQEGAKRYPQDARLHNQLADLFLENNNIDGAKSELRSALAIDPDNAYASDLLATIDMSQGEVQKALQAWNKSGRPIVDDILHNYYLTFGSWVVRDAIAFSPAGILRYSQWKTTESRLFETENFTNVGLEIEPTPVPGHYNAVVRTSTKTNSLSDLAFDLFKGLPTQTTNLDLWDIGKSGLNFNSSYRWDTDRRRASARLKFPIPLPGLMHLELGAMWRAERWDLSPVIRPVSRPSARFDYRASSFRLHLKQIPHYRVELGAGVEYRNRYAKGDLPELFTDSRNVARWSGNTSIRLADGRYQNKLRVEGFLARNRFLGDADFSGGTAELNNRITISPDSRMYLDWSVKAGTARGVLPVEDYFVLGMEQRPQNLLRGHAVADHGRYGYGPMGTDFALMNFDVERRITTLPLFNSLSIPFITLKWELFLDGAKIRDRNRIFQPSKLLLDTGGGLKFETPTSSFNIVYGRSLREGRGVLFGYVERRFW